MEKFFEFDIPAHGICDACMADPAVRMVDKDLAAIYCVHNAAGAVIILADGVPENGRWRILSPISFEDFKFEFQAGLQLLAERDAKLAEIVKAMPDRWFN